MPDGKFAFIEFHSPRVQAAYAAGVAATRAELIEAGKERALAAIDDLEDAMAEIEIEAPGSMSDVRSWLPDLRSGVRGVE